MNISAARKELPSLFDLVTDRDGEKVVITRRDGQRAAVLVSHGYVEQLELVVRRAPRQPFRLIGSGRLLVAPDEILTDIRAAEDLEVSGRQRRFARSGKKPGL